MRASSRLSSHRSKLRKNGGWGELISYSELSSQEKLFISSQVMAMVRRLPKDDPYSIFASVLYSWGIMCPHPAAKRTQMRTCYHCGSCDAYVLPLVKDIDLAIGNGW
jgi:hypothetical protein